MKLVAGAILLLIAEHSYSHYLMVPFPNNEHAATVLVPASVISLSLGALLMIWGVLTEVRAARN